MATESIYLDSLEDSQIYLSSPLPLEITGGKGGFVASWIEGGIEGEGTTRDLAVEDARKEIVAQYNNIEAKYKRSDRLRENEEKVWYAMCHYITSVARGRVRPGEEGDVISASDPSYKGPIFG